MEKKQVKVETVTYVDHYVAFDGKEFMNAEVCEKYEQSLACALRANLKEFVICQGVESDLKNAGSCEAEVLVLVPRNEQDVLHIRQIYLAIETSRLDYAAEHITNDIIGKPVMLTIGFDDEWAMFERVDDFIRCLTNGQFKVEKVDK